MSQPLDNMFITQKFGADPAYYKKWGLQGHHGLDLRAVVGTPTYAVNDGIIIASQNGFVDPLTDAYVSGEVIILRGDDFDWWYLHLSKRKARVGDQVHAGQIIGYTGNTGASTAPHLHLGARPFNPNMKNGYRGFVDPEPLLKEENEVIDTDEKANLVFYALFHEPPHTITQEARDSIKNQPFDVVISKLVKYPKWKDQNDKLVAYPKLEAAKAGGLTPEQQKKLNALEVFKEALK